MWIQRRRYTRSLVEAPWWRNPVVAGPGLLLIVGLIFQSARIVQRDRRLRESNEALSEANNELFQVNVDLQREQVLERLRGQAQGMQSSGGIGSIAGSIFQEMKDLGIAISRSSVILFHEDKGEYEYWFTTADGEFGEPISQDISEDLTKHPAYEAWKAGERHLHLHRTREELIDATRDSALRGHPLPEVEGLTEAEWPDKMDFYWLFFRQGCLKLNLLAAMSDDDLAVVERFADTFGFAYARHQELRQKEAQNRRLAVEASVQRLRAEVQSMDEASDFERILSLLTESLTAAEFRRMRHRRARSCTGPDKAGRTPDDGLVQRGRFPVYRLSNGPTGCGDFGILPHSCPLPRCQQAGDRTVYRR